MHRGTVTEREGREDKGEETRGSTPQMKRDKRTYTDQREHLSDKFDSPWSVTSRCRKNGYVPGPSLSLMDDSKVSAFVTTQVQTDGAPALVQVRGERCDRRGRFIVVGRKTSLSVLQ